MAHSMRSESLDLEALRSVNTDSRKTKAPGWIFTKCLFLLAEALLQVILLLDFCPDT